MESPQKNMIPIVCFNWWLKIILKSTIKTNKQTAHFLNNPIFGDNKLFMFEGPEKLLNLCNNLFFYFPYYDVNFFPAPFFDIQKCNILKEL